MPKLSAISWVVQTYLKRGISSKRHSVKCTLLITLAIALHLLLTIEFHCRRTWRNNSPRMWHSDWRVCNWIIHREEENIKKKYERQKLTSRYRSCSWTPSACRHCIWKCPERINFEYEKLSEWEVRDLKMTTYLEVIIVNLIKAGAVRLQNCKWGKNSRSKKFQTKLSISIVFTTICAAGNAVSKETHSPCSGKCTTARDSCSYSRLRWSEISYSKMRVKLKNNNRCSPYQARTSLWTHPDSCMRIPSACPSTSSVRNRR